MTKKAPNVTLRATEPSCKSLRFEELLAGALEVAIEQRLRFVEANCIDEEECRELLELLAMEPQLGDFLERPASLTRDDEQ